MTRKRIPGSRHQTNAFAQMKTMGVPKTMTADYLLGRCIPLVRMLVESGNEESVETMAEIRAYLQSLEESEMPL